MELVDFVAKVCEVLLYYGLPLTAALPFGMLYGKWSPYVSMRLSILWALAFGLTGLAVSNPLVWFYVYWQYNLRGNVFFDKDPHFLDPFMFQARVYITLSPIWVAVIVTLATIYVLDRHERRQAHSCAPIPEGSVC